MNNEKINNMESTTTKQLQKELSTLENKKGVVSNEEIKRIIELRNEIVFRDVWKF